MREKSWAGTRLASAVFCFLQLQMSARQFYGVGLAVIGRDQFQPHRRPVRAADEADTIRQGFALQQNVIHLADNRAAGDVRLGRRGIRNDLLNNDGVSSRGISQHKTHAYKIRGSRGVVRGPAGRALDGLFRRLKNEPQDTCHHQDGAADGQGNGGLFIHKNPASGGSLTLISLIFHQSNCGVAAGLTQIKRHRGAKLGGGQEGR